MDDHLPSKSDDQSDHRRLTLFRLIRGLICLLVFLSTAFMFVVYFGPLAAVLIRYVSVHYCRKVTSLLFSLWLALWPFFFEKINGTKVVLSGDNVPSMERVLIISNHRTEVDWMYLWNLALRKDCLGSIKYVLKSSLMKLPIFGWGFHILEFIAVERKWEVDEPIMRSMLSGFKDPRDSLWLALFPEGTDFTYDVSIAYKHQCPNFFDNVFGLDPSEVHIHVRRVRVEDIPISDTGTASWLLEAFQAKDKLLADFKASGRFPDGRMEELSTTRCLANFMVVMSITCFFTYITLFSSVWFKVYVTLSCAYLASATYFKVHTLPVMGHTKTGVRFNRKLSSFKACCQCQCKCHCSPSYLS